MFGRAGPFGLEKGRRETKAPLEIVDGLDPLLARVSSIAKVPVWGSGGLL